MSNLSGSVTELPGSPDGRDRDEPDDEPKTNPLLSNAELTALNERSNGSGVLQLIGHLAIMGISGYLWISNLGNWWVALPSLIVYGFSLASMFAPMHECAHRTAFANNRINDLVSWLAGVLSFYNSTFYRRYHKWHHRYTQIPGKDPELEDVKPRNWREYFLEVSGWYWWIGKFRTHLRIVAGKVDDYPYIPETARQEVIQSVRLQLLIYVVAIVLSIIFQQPWFVLYWLLPLIVGQPILRIILMSEHTGCSLNDNYLINTRTTLTRWPIRFLMWNMPFHAEHHLYASIPFHALPAAHKKLASHFTHVAPGYVQVQRSLIAQFDGK
jgi:fatty acid desaturase